VGFYFTPPYSPQLNGGFNMWNKKYSRQQKWYNIHKKKKRGFYFLNQDLLSEIKAILSFEEKRHVVGVSEEYRKIRWEVFNPKKAKERKEKWAKNNLDRIKESQKKYQQGLRGKEMRHQWFMKRYYKDVHFRLRLRIATIMRERLKRRLINKNRKSIIDFLPYTIDDLINHLEKRFIFPMSWNNYGTYWHIDHIIPDSYFNYKAINDKEFKECWALTNLQPLEAIANIKKSNHLPIYSIGT